VLPGGGTNQELRDRTPGKLVGSGDSWIVPTPYGAALDSVTVNNSGAYWSKLGTTLGTRYAIAILAKVDTLPAIQSKFVCIPFRANSTWNPPYVGLCFGLTATGAAFLEHTDGTTLFSAQSAVPVFDTNWHLFVAQRDNTSLSFNRDGINLWSGSFASGGTVAPNLSQGGAVHLAQRNYLNQGEGLDGKVVMAGIWNRNLSQAELSLMTADPFCFLRAPQRSLAPRAAAASWMPPPPSDKPPRVRWYPGLIPRSR
jgi:hypothetical protein